MKITGYFLLALLLAAVSGSILQSLFNLSAIAELSGGISFSDRLSTVLFDLRHFMPVLAVIFLPILLIGLVVSYLLRPYLPFSALAGYFAITALGTYVALLIINQLAPMPTLIALNRSISGTILLMCCTGLAAGLFYLLQTREKNG